MARRSRARHWSMAWLALAACVGLLRRRRGRAGRARVSRSSDWTPSPSRCSSSIEEEEARNGPFSRNLVELLTSLGLAYQEYGEHELARRHARSCALLEALQRRAVQPRSGAARGTAHRQRARDRAHSFGRGAPGTIARAREAQPRRSARRADLPRRGRAASSRTTSAICAESFRPSLRCNGAGSKKPVRRPASGKLAGYYREAIGTLVRSGGFRPEELQELAELEQGLTRTYYLEASTARRASLDPNDWATVQRPRCTASAAAAINGASSTAGARSDCGRRSCARARRARRLVAAVLAQRHGREALRRGVRRCSSSNACRRRRSRSSFRPTHRYFCRRLLRARSAASAIAGVGGPRRRRLRDRQVRPAARVTIVAVAGDAAAAEVARTSSQRSAARGSTEPAGGRRSRPWSYRLRYSLADGSLTPRL